MRNALLLTCACGLVPMSASAGDPPANGDLAVEESFEGGELGKEWNTTTGNWRIVGGVLRGREIPADEHSAATRRVVETGNAVYELRFRFVEGGEALHFGFDPARGELDKQGHLFSVIVTPTSWKVLKHLDKARPKRIRTKSWPNGRRSSSAGSGTRSASRRGAST